MRPAARTTKPSELSGVRWAAQAARASERLPPRYSTGTTGSSRRRAQSTVSSQPSNVSVSSQMPKTMNTPGRSEYAMLRRAHIDSPQTRQSSGIW